MTLFSEHLSHKHQMYQEAMETSGHDQILIASGSLTYKFRDDLSHPFSANAYFRECLPQVNQQDCYLVFHRELDRPRLLLRVMNDYWHSAPEPLPDEILATLDVLEYRNRDELAGLVPCSRSMAYIGPGDCHLKQLADATLNPEPLLNYIDYHRAWKTPFELGQLREANRMAIKGHRAAEHAFRQGLSEYEIHMAYLLAVGCREEELPYGNIIALNQNASVLHHMVLETQRPAKSGSLLIDAGAQSNGYAADISRTYISEHKNNSAGYECFKLLLEGVEALQQNLVRMLAPGVDYSDLNDAAHRTIAQLLAELDIVRAPAAQILEEGITRAFLPHGVGHLIGVQVHDKGGYLSSSSGQQKLPSSEYGSLRCTRKAEQNMVFTVEPGIYFIPVLLKPWLESGSRLNSALIEELQPYGGIRIEDDVVVTAAGVENMTRDAFSL